MFEKIKRFFSILNYSTFWNVRISDKRTAMLSATRKELIKLNNESVMEYRKIRWTLAAWAIALIGVIMSNGKSLDLVATVPFFVGFVVLQIVSIVLDFQYDIYVFQKRMKTLSKQRTKLNEMKVAIRKWAFWKTEADEMNEALKNFRLDESLIFTFARNLTHIGSLIFLFIGAWKILWIVMFVK